MMSESEMSRDASHVAFIGDAVCTPQPADPELLKYLRKKYGDSVGIGGSRKTSIADFDDRSKPNANGDGGKS